MIFPLLFPSIVGHLNSLFSTNACTHMTQCFRIGRLREWVLGTLVKPPLGIPESHIEMEGFESYLCFQSNLLLMCTQRGYS